MPPFTPGWGMKGIGIQKNTSGGTFAETPVSKEFWQRPEIYPPSLEESGAFLKTAAKKPPFKAAESENQLFYIITYHRLKKYWNLEKLSTILRKGMIGSKMLMLILRI